MKPCCVIVLKHLSIRISREIKAGLICPDIINHSAKIRLAGGGAICWSDCLSASGGLVACLLVC